MTKWPPQPESTQQPHLPPGHLHADYSVTAWRSGIVIECEHPSAIHLQDIQCWLQTIKGVDSVCTVTSVSLAPVTAPQGAPEKFRMFLGQEFEAVVYDMFSGFHPDAVAALSGCIKGGGFFVFYAPPTNQWHEFTDPGLDRLLAYPLSSQEIKSHFLSYISHQIIESNLWDCITIEDLKKAITSNQKDKELRKELKKPTQSVRKVCPPLPLNEQNQCIEQILKLANAPEGVCVISAGRGRGKSAALGMAAARWLSVQRDRKAEIWITAPGRDNVATLFKHAGTEWHELVKNHNDSTCDLKSVLKFIPPDELIHQLQSGCTSPHLLMVDEAAAIPVHLLKSLLSIRRCVFSSTTHGYEGSGQGFKLRFIPALKKQVNAWSQVHLTQPVRWAKNDPLEVFFEHLFMLGNDQNSPDKFHEPQTKRLKWQEYTAPDLARNPATLEDLFHLLRDAHYRTTPDDLRTLLDSPEIRVFAAIENNRITGCLMLSSEAPFEDPDLRIQIWQGHRRPKGHLLQQTLTQQLNIKDSLECPMIRIVRIAVQPDRQRQGTGSWMIRKLMDELKGVPCLLGASFAAEQRVTRFWEHQDFELVRLGTRRDPFTGCYSTLMLKALNNQGQTLLKPARKRFLKRLEFDRLRNTYPPELLEELRPQLSGRDFPYSSDTCCLDAKLNTNPGHDINGSLPSDTSTNTDTTTTLAVPDSNDFEELALFAAGSRPYSTVADTLYRCAIASPDFKGNQAWQCCVKEGLDPKTAAPICGLKGRKLVTEALREAVREYLAQRETV